MDKVYAVIAIETGGQVDGNGEPIGSEGFYCVCDTRETAELVIDKDTRDGHIYRGAWIAKTTMQTKEMV